MLENRTVYIISSYNGVELYHDKQAAIRAAQSLDLQGKEPIVRPLDVSVPIEVIEGECVE